MWDIVHACWLCISRAQSSRAKGRKSADGVCKIWLEIAITSMVGPCTEHARGISSLVVSGPPGSVCPPAVPPMCGPSLPIC